MRHIKPELDSILVRDDHCTTSSMEEADDEIILYNEYFKFELFGLNCFDKLRDEILQTPDLLETVKLAAFFITSPMGLSLSEESLSELVRIISHVVTVVDSSTRGNWTKIVNFLNSSDPIADFLQIAAASDSAVENFRDICRERGFILILAWLYHASQRDPSPTHAFSLAKKAATVWSTHVPNMHHVNMFRDLYLVLGERVDLSDIRAYANKLTNDELSQLIRRFLNSSVIYDRKGAILTTLLVEIGTRFNIGDFASNAYFRILRTSMRDDRFCKVEFKTLLNILPKNIGKAHDTITAVAVDIWIQVHQYDHRCRTFRHDVTLLIIMSLNSKLNLRQQLIDENYAKSKVMAAEHEILNEFNKLLLMLKDCTNTYRELLLTAFHAAPNRATFEEIVREAAAIYGDAFPYIDNGSLLCLAKTVSLDEIVNETAVLPDDLAQDLLQTVSLARDSNLTWSAPWLSMKQTCLDILSKLEDRHRVVRILIERDYSRVDDSPSFEEYYERVLDDSD